MKSGNSGAADSASSSRQASRRWARRIVIVVVLAGLWHTVQSAMKNVREQSDRITEQLSELQRQLDSHPDDQTRQSLLRDQLRLKKSLPSLANIRWWRVLAAAALYFIGLLPPAIFFHQTLVHMNQRPPISHSLRAHIMGHMGKYVPGKAMVIVIRAGALSASGVRVSVAIVAAVIETLLMMAVGASVAGALVVALDLPPMFTVMAVSLAACAAIPTLPPIFRFVVRKLANAKPGAEQELQDLGIDWSLILRGWGLMLLMWSAIGIAFAMLVQACPGADPESFTVRDYMLSSATIMLAVVAGFVSLLPGGAGVRELVVSTLLAPRMGVAGALFAAVLARLVFLGVDVLAGATLMAWRKSPAETSENGVD